MAEAGNSYATENSKTGLWELCKKSHNTCCEMNASTAKLYNSGKNATMEAAYKFLGPKAVFFKISDVLEAARTRQACGRGASPMGALLAHHGEGRGAHPNNEDRQHLQQCGHAEMVAAANALGEQLTGNAYKTHDPTERAPPLVLLLVVSRSCCNSCRFALPHLARLLRVDIVAQFRTHDGELSAPVLFAWRDAPPAAQVPWSAPTP